MDYLYAQLNKQVETATYQGRTTATAEVVVDNTNYLISVDVIGLPQYYVTLINKVKDDLDVERERAIAAEQSLSRNLNNEVVRATKAETDLQTNIDKEEARAVAVENQLREDLEEEIQRAKDAEQVLQDNYTQVATDLAIEVARAKGAEQVLTDNLELETQRAQIEEGILQGNIDTEESERKEADNTLQSNIDAEKAARIAAVTAEQERAEAAEGELRTDLDTEISNRESEDSVLQSNINAEQSRAESAEAQLQANIDSEAATREQNDTTLQVNINAENTRATTKEEAIESKVDIHIANKDNPHEVTKTQVGLNKVDNTSDAEKPVSDPTQAALDLKLDKTNADKDVVKEVDITVNGDEAYVDVTYTNLTTGVTSETPVQKNIPLADEDSAGLMSKSDYTTLYDLKDRVQNLEGKTTRLFYTAKEDPTNQEIYDFVTGLGYSYPFEGIAVVIGNTYHIWHYYENLVPPVAEGSPEGTLPDYYIGWRDDGLDTVSTFTNDTAGIIKGENTDGKVYAETDGTGSVVGWSELKGRVATVESQTGALRTDLEGSNINLNQAMQDIDALENRVYNNTVVATAEATTVQPHVPAKATATVTYDEDSNQYTYAFDFDIPKGEIGDAECTESASDGVVSYTLVNDTDKTFTSANLTSLEIVVPAVMFHGFFAGVNFRTGATPPTFTIVGEQGLAYPIKKLKRSGDQVDTYTLKANCNELLVVICDGINVYCNLMEVN